jgi:hypothetical protein
MSSPLIAIIAATVAFAISSLAEEPKELRDAQIEFQAHPSKGARIHYITQLARLRQRLVRAHEDGWQAVDAEVVRHPLPADVDSQSLAKQLVGKWVSPRHDYLFRAGGTWIMLPEVIDGMKSTHGTWRIEGTKFFQDFPGNPPDPGNTIILLNATDFIFSTHVSPYYMKRETKYP